MNSKKIGELIRRLRTEKHLTQLELAEKLHISDKTVSKWERGIGCPEISLVKELSRILDVGMEELLSGELRGNPLLNGNLKKMKFYICPNCGNLVTSIAETTVSCCGRKLQASDPVKAVGEETLSVERIDLDYFISSNHAMSKDHYITFVALLTSDTMVLKKQYPEWNLQVRMPVIGRGMLIWHCNRHGLFYQVV